MVGQMHGSGSGRFRLCAYWYEQAAGVSEEIWLQQGGPSALSQSKAPAREGVERVQTRVRSGIAKSDTSPQQAQPTLASIGFS